MGEQFCYYLVEKQKVLNPKVGETDRPCHGCTLKKEMGIGGGFCIASSFFNEGYGDIHVDYNPDTAKSCFSW